MANVKELNINSTTYDIIGKGVVDQNNPSTPLKQWTGTKAEYDAIVTKDANTIYNITDDTNPTQALLEAIYPVGSIYIGTMNTCPLATLFGTWAIVGTKILTDNPSSVPVAGNNSSIRLLTRGGTTTEVWVANANPRYLGCNATDGGNYGVMWTTDSEQSGLIADLSSVSNIVVNIWERTA